MRNCNYPIIFGSQSSPNKGLMVGKKDGHVEIHIGEVKGDYQFGDVYKAEDFVAEYAQLSFCKRESLEAFRLIIDAAIEIWDMEEIQKEKEQ